MSTTMGSQTNAGYMQLTGLGKLTIELNLKPDSNNVFNVDVAAEHRIEVLHMETQANETVDQLILRLRGMLRAMWQGEHTKSRAQTELERVANESAKVADESAKLREDLTVAGVLTKAQEGEQTKVDPTWKDKIKGRIKDATS